MDSYIAYGLKRQKRPVFGYFCMLSSYWSFFSYVLLLNFCIEVVYDNYDQLFLYSFVANGPKNKKRPIFGLLAHAKAIQYTFSNKFLYRGKTQ